MKRKLKLKTITIDDKDYLFRFNNTYFERMSEEMYSDILRTTLQVYATKPKTKEEALKQLKTYLELYSQSYERPLFMDN
jgi:hypothetical protein